MNLLKSRSVPSFPAKLGLIESSEFPLRLILARIRLGATALVVLIRRASAIVPETIGVENEVPDQFAILPVQS